jgi:transcriptional regulator with XRE-family HTH domain
MNKDKSNKISKGLTEGQVTSIKQLKADGFASRYIAALIGVSKTTVNNLLNGRSDSKEKVKEKQLPILKEGARVLLYDLEVSAALAYTFGRFKVNLSQDNIYKEGGVILCASYRWLGENDTYVIYSKEDIANNEDISVVTKLWELFNEADAVIAHNAAAFDVKVLQGRVLINGMEPLPSVKVIDTLNMAKKHFRLPSNKLDSIAEILGLGRKLPTGIALWAGVQEGDEESLEKMLDYCQHDTDLLHEVYMRLRSFGTASNFNASHYYKDDKERCNICGSTDIGLTGRVTHTDVSTFAEVRCNSCGGIHRKREVLNTKEKRKSLMANIKV